ncbi:MAG TPA: hypothetical protein VMP03_10290, partial [Methylomirabilota bacterium]|nr:hypothetical protein [Methylomirabilota bacterium]
FRMTPENMARHVGDPNMPFWRMLKEGYDHFELTRHEPKVDVCGRKYVFNATPDGPMSPAAACPGLTQPEQLRIAAAKKAAEDDAKIQVIAARIADEKKAAEENAIMIAAREEDARRRAEERRIALAERKEVLASLLGLGSTPATAAPAAEPEVLPAYSADGVPLPKPAPRDPGRMMALAPSQPASEESRSMFSRLFSFGDESLPVPVAPVSAEETLASAEAMSSEVFASASSASPLSSSIGADAPAACVDDGNSDCAAVTVMAAPAPPAQERSIIDRIGNWF